MLVLTQCEQISTFGDEISGNQAHGCRSIKDQQKELSPLRSN